MRAQNYPVQRENNPVQRENNPVQRADFPCAPFSRQAARRECGAGSPRSWGGRGRPTTELATPPPLPGTFDRGARAVEVKRAMEGEIFGRGPIADGLRPLR